MKKSFFLLGLFIISSVCYSTNPIDNCRKCVTELYNLLFSKSKITIAELDKVYNVDMNLEAQNNDSVNKMLFHDTIKAENLNFESYTMKKIWDNEVVLSQGFDKQNVLRFIQNAPITSDGLELDSILELIFPNGTTIFYEINIDPPICINLIWGANGEILISNSKMKFRRPGIINDKDGFTNIRKAPNINSEIITKFSTNELFFFTPVSKSNWWPVYSDETSPSIGYIYRNKVTYYDDFPESIKRKVKKMRSGCQHRCKVMSQTL